jgi:hypothetical protein
MMDIRPYITKNERGIKMMKKVSSFVLVLTLVLTVAVVSGNSSGTYTTSGGTHNETNGTYAVGIQGSGSTYNAPFADITSRNNSNLTISNLSIRHEGNVVTFPTQSANNSDHLRWQRVYAPGSVTFVQCTFSNVSTFYGSWSGSAWN